ncbi:fatty acyl-CoA reductase 1-like [Oppia nitens]|uniref:fatty acyl-CoA reductase 1-like n=1 Tax=Oppia nitens TaxID=1686743 RepID=UPI0023DB711D|nr:fatty acyl-CoA reductase 1-like [Oppia nitens]
MINGNIESIKIRDFYANKSILITGASGFIGKIILLKILTACPDVQHIYVLMRSKYDMSSNKRLSSMLSSVPFTYVLNDDNPVKNKVTPVEGDITSEGLGFSDSDLQSICDNVNVVFHCAASVKFDAPLKESLDYNVFATKQVINLCKQIKQLSCFIHCSTAYSHCQRREIDEQFYKVSADAHELMQMSRWLPSASLDQLSHHLMEGRPNTYTYTKALAEQLVAQECQDLPCAVVRPAIVVNSDTEPRPGWIDNVNGPSGISILGALGILRAVNWNYYAKTDFVPVDKVANAMIAVGAAVGQQNRETNLKIYNITSSNIHPITWGQIFESGYKGAQEAPSIRAVRPVIKPPKQTGPHPILNPLKVFFSHWMFAYFLDLIIMLCGHRRIMVRVTGKMHYALHVMNYFTQHEWMFRSQNLLQLYQCLDTDEKQLFNFDMTSINWDTFARNSHFGNRRHLLKESDDSIGKARQRMQRIEIAYWLFKMLLIASVAYLMSALTLYLFVGRHLLDGECRIYNNYYTVYSTGLLVCGIYMFCNRN